MTEAQFENSELRKFKEKFGRSSELTKVFDEWSESVQTFLLEQVKLENDESPILAFYQPHASWLLLTNRRLLWTNPDARSYELQLDDIEKVGWSSGPDGWAGRDPNDPPDTLVYINDASLVGKGHCGHYSPWLHFVNRSGKRFEAFLEKGNLKKVKNMIWQMSGGWKTSFDRATKENQEAKQNDPELGSDAYRARRLERNILGHGKQYTSWFFKALPAEIQNYFLSQGPFEENELLVYGFFGDSETWFVATSRRAMWSRPGFTCRLRYDKISQIRMSEMERIDKENSDEVSKVKGTSPWLCFEDIHKQRHEALLPPGSDLFAIWNSMLFMVHLEKIHPLTSEK